MKIFLNEQIIDIDETVEGMRKALIEQETIELKDIGCNGQEADEMAHETFLPLSEKEILDKIKLMEIQ